MKQKHLTLFFFTIFFSLVARSEGFDAKAPNQSAASEVVKEGADEGLATEESPLADDEEVVDQIDKLNKESEGSLEFTAFIYSERGRRNPFLKPGGGKTQALTKEETASGLEGYDIASFRLSAVLWDVKFPKAIIKASEKEVYVVEEGTKIGRRNGYVAKIREGEVVIVEPSVHPGKENTEETIYKTQVLKLGR